MVLLLEICSIVALPLQSWPIATLPIQSGPIALLNSSELFYCNSISSEMSYCELTPPELSYCDSKYTQASQDITATPQLIMDKANPGNWFKIYIKQKLNKAVWNISQWSLFVLKTVSRTGDKVFIYLSICDVNQIQQ